MAEDIAQWLNRLGLGQYAQAFADNDIEFNNLARLTENDFKELGFSIGHHGHRPADRSDEGRIGARRRPFAPVSGHIAAWNPKCGPKARTGGRNPQNRKTRRDRSPKPTGASQRPNSKRSHTAWTHLGHRAGCNVQKTSDCRTSLRDETLGAAPR